MFKVYGLLVGFGLLVATAVSLLNPFTKTTVNSFNIHAQELRIKHDDALITLKKDFNIADAIWNDHFKDLSGFITADDLLGVAQNSTIKTDDPEIVAYTKKALIEYGINPEKVAIELVNNGSAFCAMQKLAKPDMNYSTDNRIVHSIQLDLEKINTYNTDVQHAFVRHEIMHLLHYDSIEAAYVVTLLTTLGHTPEKYNTHQSMVDYRYQRELRADLLATCHDVSMAQELDTYFQNVIARSKNKDISSHSHPPYQMRHEQLSNLMQEMQTSAPKLA